jgi:signal transduction histidine kinase
MNRPWIGTIRNWIALRGDTLLAALVGGVGLFEIWVGPITAPGYRGPQTVATAGVLVLSAVLLWRRRTPWLTLATVIGVLTLQWGYARGVAQLPNASFAAILLVAYSVGAHQTRTRGLVAMLAGACAFLIQDGADLEAGYHSVRTDAGFYALFFAAWAAGLGIQALRQRAELLERLTGQLAREREEKARLAVVEERTRLARELHDVVAHSVTVMVLHAGAARQLIDSEPGKAKSTLRSAEESGRQALAELRRLLGILRSSGGGDDLSPPSGVRNLRDLADMVGRGGLDVKLVIEGEPRELAPGLDLSAYRIVQEALTNALKHARAHQASVRVHYGERQLELEVVDDGRDTGANGDGGGHGLQGLRERAALYGGTLQAGPKPGGGYRVFATLPIDPYARS